MKVVSYIRTYIIVNIHFNWNSEEEQQTKTNKTLCKRTHVGNLKWFRFSGYKYLLKTECFKYSLNMRDYRWWYQCSNSSHNQKIQFYNKCNYFRQIWNQIARKKGVNWKSSILFEFMDIGDLLFLSWKVIRIIRNL